MSKFSKYYTIISEQYYNTGMTKIRYKNLQNTKETCKFQHKINNTSQPDRNFCN